MGTNVRGVAWMISPPLDSSHRELSNEYQCEGHGKDTIGLSSLNEYQFEGRGMDTIGLGSLRALQ